MGVISLVTSIDVVMERRSFRSAVPLDDPPAVLPVDDALRRRWVDGRFLLFMLVPSLLLALLVTPAAALWGLPMAGWWLFEAGHAAYWERKHGLLVWRGHVDTQPLGKGQVFYTSARRPPVLEPGTTSPRTDPA